MQFYAGTLVERTVQLQTSNSRERRVWEEIAEKLNSINDPKFKVSKRSVREHFQLLLSKLKTRRRSEGRAFGIELEDIEVKQSSC